MAYSDKQPLQFITKIVQIADDLLAILTKIEFHYCSKPFDRTETPQYKTTRAMFCLKFSSAISNINNKIDLSYQ